MILNIIDILMWYDGPFLFISEDLNRNNIGHHDEYICIKCRLKSENNLIIIAVPITQNDINNIKSNKISYDKIFLQSNVYYKGWFNDYDSLEVEVFDLNEDIKEQLFGENNLIWIKIIQIYLVQNLKLFLN
jgi:hypothetical protein